MIMIIIRQKEFTGETKLINKALKNLKLTEMGRDVTPKVIKVVKGLPPSNIRKVKKVIRQSPLQGGRAILRNGTDYKSSHIDGRITDKGKFSNLIKGDHTSKKELKKKIR